MIAEIQRLIDTGRLAIAPLNDDGVSVNPMTDGVLFVLADERNEMLRFYRNAAPLTDFVQSRPTLLMSLLALTGPACAYADLRLGCDRRGNYLWAAATVAYSDLTDAYLIERFERFKRDSARLTADVLACINRAAESEAAQSGDIARAATQTTAAGARDRLNVADGADGTDRTSASSASTSTDVFEFTPTMLWG